MLLLRAELGELIMVSTNLAENARLQSHEKEWVKKSLIVGLAF